MEWLGRCLLVWRQDSVLPKFLDSSPWPRQARRGPAFREGTTCCARALFCRCSRQALDE